MNQDQRNRLNELKGKDQTTLTEEEKKELRDLESQNSGNNPNPQG